MLLVQYLQRGRKVAVVVGALALSLFAGSQQAWAAAPVIDTIADNPLNLTEDQAGSTTFNVSDTDNDPLITVTATSSNQTLIPNANISITPGSGPAGQHQISITPATNQSGGPVTINLVADDGTEQGNASFVVNVAADNDAPQITSVPSSFDLDEDIGETFTAQISISDVDNASGLAITCAESGGSKLASVSCTPASGGPGTRDITINPASNQNGSTAVKITVTDPDGKTAEATVTVNIAAINDDPVLTVPANFTIDEDVPGGGTVSIADPDNTSGLTITCTESSALINSVSCLPVTDGLGNRTVSITPVGNANGSTSITIRVEDGSGGSDQEVVPVNITAVNDDPVLTVPSSFPMTEDTVGTFNGGQVSVSDVDDASNLTMTCSESSALISSITCEPSPSGPGNRTVTITPAANANGSTTVTIRVTDSGGKFDEKPVTVNIAAVNDAPTYGTLGPLNTNEDTLGSISIPISDVDGDTMTLSATSGNTAIVANSGITVTGSGNSRTVQVQGLPNQHGTVQINLLLSDGKASPVSASFNAVIQSVADAPIISIPNAVPIPEDGLAGPLPFTIVDPDGDAITAISTVSFDNLIPSSNITVTNLGGGNYTLQASPRPNDAGRWASIRIRAESADNLATQISFPITVTKVADAPTFLNFPFTQTVIKGGSTGPVSIVGFDADCYTAGDCADTSSMTLVSNNTSLVPNSAANIAQRKTATSFFFGNFNTTGLIGITTTREIIITPTANLTGVAVINVTINDGTGLLVSRPLTVVVISTNKAPQFVAEGNELVDTTMLEDSTRNLNFIVQDEDNDPLQVSASSSNLVLLPLGALTLGGSGSNRSLNIVPAANQFGTATIVVTLTDGVSTTVRNFLLTVTSVNDAPTISTIDNQSLSFNNTTGALPFTVGDIETAVGSLQVTASSSNVSVVPLNKITLGGTGASRTVQVDSGTTSGSSTITLNVSDGISTTATSFVVNVVGNNLPPTISAIADQAMDRNTTLGPLAFTVGDDLLPASGLTVTVTTDNPVLFPSSGLQLGGSSNTRTITLKPAANLGGTARITITVSDDVYSVPRGFTVTVKTKGVPPTVTAPKPTNGSTRLIDGVVSVPFTFTVGDSDTALGDLQLSIISSNPSIIPPGNVQFNQSLSGSLRSLTIAPLPNQAGTVILTVVVRDGEDENANVASAQFSVSIWRNVFMPNSLQLYDPYDIDANESNNTYARAFPIVIGAAYHGTVFSNSVSVADTVDVLSLSLSKGRYRIQLDFSGADIDLYLRDNSSGSFKTLAKSDQTSETGPEVITYDEAQTGPLTRYIVVSFYSGSPGSKGYRIIVTKLS